MLDYRSPPAPRKPKIVSAGRGLVLEEPLTGWVGAIVRAEKAAGGAYVELEDRFGKRRAFPLTDEFWIDGEPVALVLPSAIRGTTTKPTRTASGMLVDPGVATRRAQVARGSRIWVEGRHDAELVEKIWGEDLREYSVVVEMLDGVDQLAERLAEFGPTSERRVGVLVDHLIPGTKESRLVDAAIAAMPEDTVLVRGHKFVDIWQAVKPERVGLKAWPVIPHSQEWKVGILNHLGWPAGSQEDIANGWHRILRQVRDYRDLEASLLGPVEELIDFVTA
ncbi:MAG: DUF3097 domain-containing protein [Promicromonosporaceae bacterium]|nr:DUF3097 domain-containing protein [Promicromonosporaceae bacterium]